MPITCPDPPYSYDALEPYISNSAVRAHHDNHHRASFQKVIEFETLRLSVLECPSAGFSLEQLIGRKQFRDHNPDLFNNAVEAWNHAFYWNSMCQGGGGAPTGEIGRRIASDFGDYRSFAEQFATAAITYFGSGWLWLVLDRDSLQIAQTSSGVTPILCDQTPIIAIDLWEHAYYLDYQNRKADYVTAFLEHLICWDFASNNLIRKPDVSMCRDLAV